MITYSRIILAVKFNDKIVRQRETKNIKKEEKIFVLYISIKQNIFTIVMKRKKLICFNRI